MEPELRQEHGVRLAIEGCGHGTLHAIYASIEEACKRKNWPDVDLLIIGGDFQSVRNGYDLECVSMPAKYREMCDFHEYYSGQRTAPYLTVFVGGNHEASNYLFELYYGGWVAPNIYYMGAANVLRLGPLRIAGMSGIWKGYNYRKPHYERLPYNESEIKSVYHTREMDVRKLLQIRSQVDIGISHDWPKGVEWQGNWKTLFNHKRHLEEDARNGQLGNVAAQQVLDRLRPKYWFSAHLHCKYSAIVNHEAADEGQQALAGVNGGSKQDDENHVQASSSAAPNNADEIELDLDEKGPSNQPEAGPAAGNGPVINADEIDLELDDDINGVALVAPGQGQDNVAVPVTADAPMSGPTLTEEAARAALPDSFRRPAPRAPPEPMEHPPEISNKTTEFLALDKCLPNKQFLQLLLVPTDEDVEPKRPLQLAYDREWLAITRAFIMTEPPVFGDPEAKVPFAKSQAEYKILIEEQRKWLDENLSDEALLVPQNFEVIAPVYAGSNVDIPQSSTVEEFPNPQTAQFCDMLQIPNALAITAGERAARIAAGPRPDPDAERFAAGRGRGGSYGYHGRGRGGRGDFRGRGRGRGGGGRGRFRGR
jgi:lariat debranching enzyme